MRASVWSEDRSGAAGFEARAAVGRDIGAGPDPWAGVSAIPEVHAGVWVPVSWRPRVEWVHHTKKFAVGDLICLGPHRRTVGLRLVLETWQDRVRGAQGYHALQLLWTAGLRPPSPHQVPRPYAWDADAGVLVRAYVPGQTWADAVLRETAVAPEASEWAASWAVALQRAQVPKDAEDPPAERPAAAGVDRVLGYAADLAALAGRADERRALRRAAMRVAERLDRPAELALVLSHGDFHPKNLLLAGPTVAGLDLDRVALAEPAADVGAALAQLLSMSLARTHSTTAGATAGQRFWASYCGIPGGASWERVAVHVAANLLGCIHYSACAKHGRWPGTPRQWAYQIEQWARGDGPRILADLQRHPWETSRDPFAA